MTVQSSNTDASRFQQIRSNCMMCGEKEGRKKGGLWWSCDAGGLKGEGAGLQSAGGASSAVLVRPRLSEGGKKKVPAAATVTPLHERPKQCVCVRVWCAVGLCQDRI